MLLALLVAAWMGPILFRELMAIAPAVLEGATASKGSAAMEVASMKVHAAIVRLRISAAMGAALAKMSAAKTKSVHLGMVVNAPTGRSVVVLMAVMALPYALIAKSAVVVVTTIRSAATDGVQPLAVAAQMASCVASFLEHKAQMDVPALIPAALLISMFAVIWVVAVNAKVVEEYLPALQQL